MDSIAEPLAAIMLDALWQSSLCLAVGIAAATALHRRPAQAHALLLVAIVAAVAAPAASALFRGLGWGLFEPADAVARHAAPPPIGLSATGSSAGVVMPEMPVVLLIAWLVISAAFLGRLASSMALGARLAGEGQPLSSPRWRAAARAASVRLGLATTADLFASAAVRCPVIWCWGRPPRVLLPPAPPPEHAAPVPGDDDDLFGVLCHELAHFKRADHVASLLSELAVSLLPWSPLAWIARRRLRMLSEQCCDAWALAAGTPAVRYAEMLLGLARQPARAWSLAAVSGRCSTGRRIARILQEGPGDPDPGMRFRAVVAVLSVGLVTVAALAQRRAAPEAAAGAPRAVAALPALHGPEAPGDRGARQAHRGVEMMPGELDLGQVAAGGSRMGSMWLVNNGDRPRRVESARTSCGCTTVHDFQPTTLQPGESMMVEITMSGPDKAGLSKTKYVTFLVHGQEPLRLPVHLAAVEPVH